MYCQFLLSAHTYHSAVPFPLTFGTRRNEVEQEHDVFGRVGVAYFRQYQFRIGHAVFDRYRKAEETAYLFGGLTYGHAAEGQRPQSAVYFCYVEFMYLGFVSAALLYQLPAGREDDGSVARRNLYRAAKQRYLGLPVLSGFEHKFRPEDGYGQIRRLYREGRALHFPDREIGVAREFDRTVADEIFRIGEFRVIGKAYRGTVGQLYDIGRAGCRGYPDIVHRRRVTFPAREQQQRTRDYKRRNQHRRHTPQYHAPAPQLHNGSRYAPLPEAEVRGDLVVEPYGFAVGRIFAGPYLFGIPDESLLLLRVARCAVEPRLHLRAEIRVQILVHKSVDQAGNPFQVAGQIFVPVYVLVLFHGLLYSAA